MVVLVKLIEHTLQLKVHAARMLPDCRLMFLYKNAYVFTTTQYLNIDQMFLINPQVRILYGIPFVYSGH